MAWRPHCLYGPGAYVLRARKEFLKQDSKDALTSVWLRWLGIVLLSEASLVQFPVGAHAWAAASVPRQGACGRQPAEISLTLPPFLPLSLKMNK